MEMHVKWRTLLAILTAVLVRVAPAPADDLSDGMRAWKTISD
jgi:hypothetical protein